MRDCFLFVGLLLISSLAFGASASPETLLPPGAEQPEVLLPSEGFYLGMPLAVRDLPDLGEVQFRAGASIHPGFPVFLNPPTNSQPYTPTLDDIDGDGADEIFVTGQHTFGIRGDGTFLPGWPTEEQEFAGYGSNANLPGPSVADFEPGGAREVLWTIRDWWAGSSRLWTFNARRADGTDLPGYPQEAPDTPSNSLWTPFVLGDTDEDGDLEAWGAHTLGHNSDVNRISALDAVGNLLFTIDLAPAESVKSLHFGDLDGDAHKEMFAIAELGSFLRLHVFNGDGTSAAGYPINLLNLAAGGLASGPPVPADLDCDGDLELLVVHYDPRSFVQCFHHDGGSCSGFPLLVAPNSQPLSFAIGDVTGDGDPEMVLLQVDLDTGDPLVFVLDLATRSLLPGWPFPLPDLPGGLPAIADVTGDGVQDVLVATTAGAVLAVSGAGGLISGYPKEMISTSISGVAVGDIDGDGYYELVAATWDGWVYAWDTDGVAAVNLADWPMRGVNPWNTGVFGDSEEHLFCDGFESGESTVWSVTHP